MSPPPTRPRAEIVVILEFGTNAVRSMLARIQPGVGFTVLKEAREPTRLGPRSGRMSSTAIRATLDAVGRFLHNVRERDRRLVAVATAAVREARNASTLLDALREDHDLDVRVLSGAEEAELAALAAMTSLPFTRARVVDLGGGSLQLADIDDGRTRVIGSLPLGVLATSRRFFGAGRATAAQVRALRREVAAHAGPLLHRTAPGPIVGLGGSIRALARMQRATAADGSRRSLHGLRLDAAPLSALRMRLEALPVRRRREVPGLKAERADTILAGAIIVEELLALAGATALTVCGRGVRHGVLIQETFGGRVPA
jgi:exopolyphosphatase/guanosine-5'-triphosphate,3'-diphosphate pyrophosphatase